MKISNPKQLLQKELIVFDLDGTIAPSKSSMDRQMSRLLIKLLANCKVAVISGGEMKQFKIQLLDPLQSSKSNLSNLFLFPTTSTSFYKWSNGGWKRVYSYLFKPAEVKKIYKAFKEAFVEAGYAHPKKTYGQVIQNRGSQVTFSALGQKVVAMLGKKGLRLKEQWKNDHTKDKMNIAKALARRLPDLSVHAAGFTSIDVTKKGIDKAYGVRQIEKHLKVPIKKMLFVGDAIFKGGNDYAALKTGIDYVAVKNPEETKKLIKKLLA